MEDFYHAYLAQKEGINFITGCADIILDMLNENMEQAKEIQKNVQGVKDYKTARPMLTIRLVNGKLNREKLATHPHMPFLDMEIVFYLEAVSDGYMTGSIAVSDDLFQKWNISLEQMYQDALANMQKKSPMTIRPMQEILRELMGEIPELPDDGLFVLSNERNMYGAASILYPGTLETLAGIMGGDFCLIPSSVHEFIVCSRDMARDVEWFGEMIQEINQEQVEATEVLSDHPYFYSVEKKKVIM